MSRTDDVINVAGHRLSTGHIEEVIAGHSHVAEVKIHRGLGNKFSSVRFLVLQMR
jgi:acyl-coenzyme A synthetase/AMP-(fatty) acid ligase